MANQTIKPQKSTQTIKIAYQQNVSKFKDTMNQIFYIFMEFFLNVGLFISKVSLSSKIYDHQFRHA